jgi:hypothetical protein
MQLSKNNCERKLIGCIIVAIVGRPPISPNASYQKEAYLQIDFVKVAPYLKDPLVLIGFFLFICFLFARLLVKQRVIPPLPADIGISGPKDDSSLRLPYRIGFDLPGIRA